MISEDTVVQYERDGAVCVRGLFSQAWLELLAAGLERNLAEPGPHAKTYTEAGRPGFFFGDYCNWQRIPEYRQFAFASPAADLAAAVMRSTKVNFFHEHVLVKEPRTEDRTPWHHDQPYWVVDGNQVCSIWLPLDPVPQDVCVEFIKGSHRWDKWFTPKRFADHDDHPSREGETIPDIDGNRHEYDMLCWSLEPGDCIVFHALTVHGAPGNSSATNRRRAIATRWTGDDARFTRREGFMSPPFEEVTLPPGAAMDSPTFPVVRS
ncbi:phytanoyl-CoA dioxygenase family protein [Candidatus Entotheonella palauensis]|uniref:phytanoyl-CoA dioxygenase family protein n=1 Tax=Candidatus Entotheonella palauensis TaxID=93172 RepID=UPI000B7F6524|nr:phytanoyl-CoA dioxygenase family protein [Candidatus Entotheonella palauensis]